MLAMLPTAPRGHLATDRDLVAAFMAGLRENTRAAYAGDLADFAAWLGSPTPAAAADHLTTLAHGDANATALSYRAALIERGLSPASINRRLAALRSLVTLARTIGRVAWELEVSNVKSQAYRDTRGPGRDPYSAALGALAARSDAKGARDVALLRLLHDCALRRSEAIGLDLSDYSGDAGTIAIVGKGRTERETLTLPDPTRAAIEAWLQLRGRESGPLFRNFDPAGKGDGRLTGRAVHQICKAFGFRPHGLRHTAITAALDKTDGDVRAVRHFSRHRNIQTLLVYDDNRQDIGGRIARMVAE